MNKPLNAGDADRGFLKTTKETPAASESRRVDVSHNKASGPCPFYSCPLVSKLHGFSVVTGPGPTLKMFSTLCSLT